MGSSFLITSYTKKYARACVCVEQEYRYKVHLFAF